MKNKFPRHIFFPEMPTYFEITASHIIFSELGRMSGELMSRRHVCVNKNFNLGNNFLTRSGLSYCTCVFFVTRPFAWYRNF